MKKVLLLLIFFATYTSLSAQDEAIFTHYHVAPILVNPASAGFFDSHQFLANARAQWTGFADSPKTYSASYNGPIGNTLGLGLTILSESAAQLNRFRGQLNYAFRFSIKEDVKLAAGFSTEFQRMSVDNEVTGSNFFQAGDDLLDDLLDGKGVFDASLGLFATYRENTYFGLAFTNLVRSRLDDIAGNGDNQSFFQYYIFMLGHKFEIDGANFTLEPSMQIRDIRLAPFQVDFNLKAGFLDETLVAGVSYHTLGDLGILLGTKLSSFNLFYSYDVSFRRFQQFNMGSHEITLLFNLKKKAKAVDRGY